MNRAFYISIGDMVKITRNNKTFWNIIEGIDGDHIIGKVNNIIKGENFKLGDYIVFYEHEIIETTNQEGTSNLKKSVKKKKELEPKNTNTTNVNNAKTKTDYFTVDGTDLICSKNSRTATVTADTSFKLGSKILNTTVNTYRCTITAISGVYQIVSQSVCLSVC